MIGLVNLWEKKKKKVELGHEMQWKTLKLSWFAEQIATGAEALQKQFIWTIVENKILWKFLP